jgi:hypothetical protein
MKSKKEKFFEKWVKDWEKNKEKYATDQAELFRMIRDRENLQIRLERRLNKVLKELSKTISEEVYFIKQTV